MSRSILSLVIALTAFGSTVAGAQENRPRVPEDRIAKALPRQRLSGPRFGFTVFTGETADLRSQAGLEPLMSQFGWQFETQIVSLTGGNQALMEWIVLLGGVEQDQSNASLSWMAGYRLENGVELGAGPNLSYTPSLSETNTAMVVAGGATLPFGDLFIPLNVAVSFAEGGPRVTTLMGWIVG
jgi:hypothetical protein